MIILDNLEIIIESIRIVEKRFENISTAEDFIKNPEGVQILDSICMRLQIIGELTKKIDKINPEYLENFPVIEWPKIMKLRDIISHHYEQVDHEIIFDICENHIPILGEIISTMLESSRLPKR
jgi:uncharacterized protein with HEPN domain